MMKSGLRKRHWKYHVVYDIGNIPLASLHYSLASLITCSFKYNLTLREDIQCVYNNTHHSS